MRDEYQKEYGWFILAKQVREWTGETYDVIMNKPIVEVLGIVIIMKAQIEIQKESNKQNAQ